MLPLNFTFDYTFKISNEEYEDDFESIDDDALAKLHGVSQMVVLEKDIKD